MSDATITAVGSAIIAIIGGGATAAWLTGALTIRQKKISRRQKRRARAYVEAIAWIKLAMMDYLDYKASVPGPGPGGTTDRKPATVAANPVATAEKYVSPVTGTKFWFSVPAGEEVGLGSNYFAAVRAQVVTFGSHDMARAFDRWVNAFSEVLQNGGHDSHLKLDPKLESAPEETRTALKAMTCYTAIFPSNDSPLPGTTDPENEHDPGLPDTAPGCLTRAVECCASWELRLG